MEQYSLSIKRVLNAPTAKVFRAWTDPELAKQWFSPENMTTPLAEIVAEKGGAYNITMLSQKNGEAKTTGNVKEIIPNKKLVFTWFDGKHGDGQTLVTVDFKDIGNNKTEIILTHEMFNTEKSKLEHKSGWESVLNKLDKFLSI